MLFFCTLVLSSTANERKVFFSLRHGRKGKRLTLDLALADNFVGLEIKLLQRGISANRAAERVAF